MLLVSTTVLTTVLVLLPGESHEYYDPINTMSCYSFHTIKLLQYYYYCITVILTL